MRSITDLPTLKGFAAGSTKYRCWKEKQNDMSQQQYRIERIRIDNLEAELVWPITIRRVPLSQSISNFNQQTRSVDYIPDHRTHFESKTLVFDRNTDADFLKAVRESLDRKDTESLLLIGPDGSIVATIEGTDILGTTIVVKPKA